MRGSWVMAARTAVVACTLACGGPAVFVCEDDGSCGPDGVCEPVGYCSFPDIDCPSGRRFGALASAELANTCVGDVDPTGESGSSPSTTATTSITSTTSTTPDDDGSGSETTSAIGSSSSTTSGIPDTDTSSSSGGSTLDEGLILHLPLDDDFATQAGALDVSGNALHAACEMCPTSVPGRVGMAAGFETDAVLHIEDQPLLRPEDAFSISVWALDADPSSMVTQFIVGKAISGVSNTFQLSTSLAQAGMGADELVWRVVELPTSYGFYIPNPLAADAWHHLAGTWDGMTSTLWVDGEIANQIEAPPGVSYDTGQFTVGADLNDAMHVYWYRGAIDEVRLYDRALTPEEVAELAQR